MHYLHEKHYKPIIVQYRIANGVSCVPRLTLLILQTSSWNRTRLCRELTVFDNCILKCWASLVAQTVKNLPTMQHAAAAKSPSCPTPCDPIDSSPPGSPVPGILQARILEWSAISFSNAWKWKVKGKSLSRVQLLATPWTAAHQAPPSMGFSRQEYWSRVPLPSLTMQDTWVQFLGQEDPLEKGMATHSNILARRIPQVLINFMLSMT